ncbi:MAG TPA: hypothetical protein VGI16_09135 [Candidatus Acidoferrum sp.]|jgi:hypothetical protein
MPGSIPGFLGVTAFAAIKFTGYSLAVFGLKKLQPAITTAAMKIAAARTALGFVLGPPATIFGLFLAGRIFANTVNSPIRDVPIYSVLFIARILIWALILFLFTKKSPLPRPSFWLYSFLGAIVSSLLDWPGYALAIAAPGKLTFC